jgi:hypothetical protein
MKRDGIGTFDRANNRDVNRRFCHILVGQQNACREWSECRRLGREITHCFHRRCVEVRIAGCHGQRRCESYQRDVFIAIRMRTIRGGGGSLRCNEAAAGRDGHEVRSDEPCCRRCRLQILAVASNVVECEIRLSHGKCIPEIGAGNVSVAVAEATARQAAVRGYPICGAPRVAQRQILTDTSYPWLLTGKIFTSDGTGGSGVLVGDRLVLTARHVVPWTSIAAGNWWMKFVPAYFDGREPFGSSYVSDVTNYGTDDSEYNLSHDYAVLRLYDPLGAWLGYLGSSEFDDGWRNNDNFINIGYMLDIAGSQEPVWQRYWIEDDYEDDDGQTLETEASLNYGASGGPFFGWFNNGSQIRVIGAVTGETGFGDDVDNSLAGGPNMVNLIDWGRANWPK